MKSEITRRRFGTVVGGALASFACGSEHAFGGFGGALDANDGRLSARPAPSDATGRPAEGPHPDVRATASRPPLGLITGDLLPRVVASSPAFTVNPTAQGKPRFFISPGTSDPILPIDQASRVIVPALKRRGYDVTFREFDGGHQVPPD